ncbi:MAG: PhnD/SsuA/transferrin family substrate-binding protein [Gammaproteobacteria bacterium]|jgi:ABC-type phosphate/phosphonate transport system substrate-binding protein
MRNNAVFVGVLLSFFVATEALARDLIFTAPPRETKEAGQKLYGPIADHLSKLLNTKVVYEHPNNWLKYQRDMRNDKYDIVFDGPHFASWRIAHLGHEPLVKLPGHLQFVLVTDKDNNEIKSSADMIGKSMCGISPPNLSTLSMLKLYSNPARQPMIKGIKGGMGKVFKTFKAGKCDAAVLRTAFFKKKLKKEQQDSVKKVVLSNKMPNQVITVSKRISKEAKFIIQKSLTQGVGVKSTKGILKRYAGKAKSFIKAETVEYLPHTALLEGVIFGW